MIEVGSTIKFNGAVSSIGTAAYTAGISEFFIDGQWRRFIEPKQISVATADYDNHLTASELAFLSSSLERLMRNTTFDEHEKEVADSILKKLKS